MLLGWVSSSAAKSPPLPSPLGPICAMEVNRPHGCCPLVNPNQTAVGRTGRYSVSCFFVPVCESCHSVEFSLDAYSGHIVELGPYSSEKETQDHLSREDDAYYSLFFLLFLLPLPVSASSPPHLGFLLHLLLLHLLTCLFV